MSSRRLYPKLPIVGVGILIQRGDEYLLIKRASEPDAGLWSIPGGLVEVGERVEEAARREAKEETGLDVHLISLLDVIDKIVYDEDDQIKYHFVILDYIAEPVSGTMAPRDDALEARWVHPKDLHRYELSPTLMELLESLNIHGEY
ncbi:MAG: NUDIX hydrolase [Candidatus Bathyarchaeia archaeon]